jgi:hypothetical protein
MTSKVKKMKKSTSWSGLRFVSGWSIAIFLSYLFSHFILTLTFGINIESAEYSRNIKIMLLGISLLSMVLPGLILNKTLSSRKSLQTFGNLKFRLPVLFKEGNQPKHFSKRDLIREFFMSILLIPTGYYIFRILEFSTYGIVQALTTDIVKFKYQENSLLFMVSIMSVLELIYKGIIKTE